MNKYILLTIILTASISCKKVKEYNHDPEIVPLQQGLMTSSAIGYCASIAYSAFVDGNLPKNVVLQAVNNSEFSSAGILLVSINEDYPLQFVRNVGQIAITGLWDGDDGVINIAFMDVNIIEEKYEFIGLYTIPVMKQPDGNLSTLFAEQDIIIGNGSQDLLQLNLSKVEFYEELTRLDQELTTDASVLVKQNIWFVNINQDSTAIVYDDTFIVNGGGQIAKVSSESGGVLYHALLNTKFGYVNCPFNPTRGTGFIQNFQAGSTIDLGNITLNFHENCDGKAYVAFAIGKYTGSNGQNVNLGL
jgi:hypothetical protein